MSEKPKTEDTLAHELTVALRLQKKDFLERGEIMKNRHVLAKIKEVLSPYRVTKRRAPAPGRAKKSAMSDAEWFAMLEKSPAYEGIDIRREFEKCKVWSTTNADGSVSRKRLVNWLNKAARDKPVSGGGRRGAARGDVYTEPEGWREVLRRIGAKWDPDKLDEMCRGDWGDLPLGVRTEILKAL